MAVSVPFETSHSRNSFMRLDATVWPRGFRFSSLKISGSKLCEVQWFQASDNTAFERIQPSHLCSTGPENQPHSAYGT